MYHTSGIRLSVGVVVCAARPSLLPSKGCITAAHRIYVTAEKYANIEK